MKYINAKFRLNKKTKKQLAFYSAIKKLNLEKLLPLLIDDYIEEIFLDSPHEEIYLNHQILLIMH